TSLSRMARSPTTATTRSTMAARAGAGATVATSPSVGPARQVRIASTRGLVLGMRGPFLARNGRREPSSSRLGLRAARGAGRSPGSTEPGSGEQLEEAEDQDHERQLARNVDLGEVRLLRLRVPALR